MKKNVAAVMVTLIFCFVVIWGSGCAKEAKKEDPKLVFEQKCSQCHAADRIKEVHKNTPLTQEGLKNIVQKMASKPVCNINANEAKEIETYLLGELGPVSAPGM